jgi:iron complex outermembrane receptor protein
MKACRTIFLVLVALTASIDAFGQQTLRITGTVDDGAGVVSGATVSLRGPDGSSRQATTDAVGNFRFDVPSTGEFQLTVSRDGYASLTQTVALTGDAQAVNLTLRPAGVVASVDVVATAPGISAPSTAGSRLNLPVMDTPASIAVLSGDEIRIRGNATVNSAVTLAPGMTSTNDVDSGGNTVGVRGFGGSSVAFMYDGIRNAAGLGNLAWPHDPWTIDRIEVLNGPASVLYGMGGIGGAINIIPRRPSRTSEHTVRLSAGSMHTYNAALDTTGPLTERVAYRFSVSQQLSNNDINRGDSESTALSGSLAFAVSDALRLTFMNDWAYIQPMTYNGLPLVNGVALESLRQENYATSDSKTWHKENSTRVELDWNRSSTFSLRNVTSVLRGLRQWKMGPTELNYRPATNDILRSAYYIYDHDQWQWTNLLIGTSRRPIANRDNALSIGAEVERIDFIHITSVWPDATTVSLVDPIPGLYPITAPDIESAQDNVVYEYAVFADDRWALTPALSLIGGIRYDAQQFNRTDVVTEDHTKVSRTLRMFSGRLAMVYVLRPSANVYAQYSRGTDPASGNIAISADSLRRLKPNRGHQVEVGLKQSLRGGRFEWTLAGYRIVKKDLLVPDPERFNTLIQIGSQSSQGIEASASLDVGGGLRVAVNGTVLKPQFDDLFEIVNGVRTSRNGNRPTRVPTESANVMLTWTGANWLAQGTVRHVGDRYINRANTSMLPSYTVVDGSLRRTLTDRIAVDLRVNNLLDAFYPYNHVDDGRGGGSWMLGAPRSFALAVTTTF